MPRIFHKDKTPSQHYRAMLKASLDGKYYEYVVRSESTGLRFIRCTDMMLDASAVISSHEAHERYMNEPTFTKMHQIRGSKHQFFYDIDSNVIVCCSHKRWCEYGK